MKVGDKVKIPVSYTIKEGDQLADLAERAGMTLKEFVKKYSGAGPGTTVWLIKK
jgi:allophanate hydrolase subunit 1